MPCNACQDPTLCTSRCQAYAQQLEECAKSGQMDSSQVAAHVEAGEMPEHCASCGGSGDVHDLTGEWRGRCTCPAGAPVGINGLTEAETSATASVFGLVEAGEMPAKENERG